MTSRCRGNHRRDHLYIISDILQIAKDGAIKTQILYKANLSSAQLKKYLFFLLENKLLEAPTNDRKRAYKTTPKGLQLLQSYMEIMDLLNGEAYDLKGRNSLICLVRNGNSPICTVKRFG